MRRDRSPAPIERALARSRAPEPELALRGAAVGVIVAVPTVAVAGALRGIAGVRGAALAAGLVISLFALTGLVLACVARWRPATLPAASLAGAVARMVAYGVLLAALAGVDGIDRPSTVGATCLLLIVTLAYEMHYISTTPGFYWVRLPAPDGARAKGRTRG
jgi:hypothetical protein